MPTRPHPVVDDSKAPMRKLGLIFALFWLAMTALLARREGVLAPAPEPPRPARPAVTGETWLGLFAPGAEGSEDRHRVGLVHLREGSEEREGVAGRFVRLRLDAELELFARRTDLRVAGWLWRADQIDLTELAVRVASGEASFAAEATVRGGRLRGEVSSAGETLPLDLAVPTDLTLSGGLGTALLLPRLEVGEVARVESLDPLTLRAGTATIRALRRERIRIAERPVDALAVEIDSGGLETLAWVDLDGEVLRATTPIGLVLERIDPDRISEPAALPGESLLRLTAVEPRGVTPRRGARSLVLRATDRRGGGVALPHDSSQRAAEADGATRIAPAAPGRQDPAPEEADLGADPFVQSSHPAVVEQAEAIVAGVGARPRARAEAIHHWVHRHLEKTPVLSIPSALDVLATRRGDCNEHTVLFTALARAVGLPTRIAVGLVWSDDLGGFYYHAWPEVHLDGAWHWMDPTLGQVTADATHVKLLNGGIESWTGILPTLGSLEIEVLEVEG